MPWPLIVAFSAIGLGLVGLAFAGYMLYRNQMVYQYRRQMIDTDMVKYETLPSYDHMMAKFWVWPLSKFETK